MKAHTIWWGMNNSGDVCVNYVAKNEGLEGWGNQVDSP